jgi:FtsH-binding integral membrane protein
VAEIGRQPGWREVLVLAGAVVAIVLGAAVVTSLLPTGLQDTVFHQPLLIGVLIVGTGGLLWRISRPRRDGLGAGSEPNGDLGDESRR